MDTLYTYTEIMGIEKADYNGNITIKYIKYEQMIIAPIKAVSPILFIIKTFLLARDLLSLKYSNPISK